MVGICIPSEINIAGSKMLCLGDERGSMNARVCVFWNNTTEQMGKHKQALKCRTIKTLTELNNVLQSFLLYRDSPASVCSLFHYCISVPGLGKLLTLLSLVAIGHCSHLF